jgi:hypothetical protein
VTDVLEIASVAFCAVLPAALHDAVSAEALSFHQEL